MVDLAQTDKESAMTVPGKPKQPRYPDLTLRDANVEKVKGEHECTLGDEYVATVRLRVKGISDDEFGSRLEFDVLSIDEFTPADGATQDDSDEEEAADEEPAKNGKAPKAMTYS